MRKNLQYVKVNIDLNWLCEVNTSLRPDMRPQ
jgi:hypothetical protein